MTSSRSTRPSVRRRKVMRPTGQLVDQLGHRVGHREADGGDVGQIDRRHRPWGHRPQEGPTDVVRGDALEQVRGEGDEALLRPDPAGTSGRPDRPGAQDARCVLEGLALEEAGQQRPPARSTSATCLGALPRLGAPPASTSADALPRRRRPARRPRSRQEPGLVGAPARCGAGRSCLIAVGLDPDVCDALRARATWLGGATPASRWLLECTASVRGAPAHGAVQGQDRPPADFVSARACSPIRALQRPPTSSCTTTEAVPVGDDQRRRIELARGNPAYPLRHAPLPATAFVVPQQAIPEPARRVDGPPGADRPGGRRRPTTEAGRHQPPTTTPRPS